LIVIETEANSGGANEAAALGGSSSADIDSMLSDLIEAKMALAHTALELEDERQKSKQLRLQINKLDKSGDNNPVVQPTKKKNFFG